jgi:hypothetical protein
LPEGAFENFQTAQARSLNPSENSVVSDSPDAPAHNYNNFHEEITSDLRPEAFERNQEH